MFASVLSLCWFVCVMVSVTHGELAEVGNLSLNAFVNEFWPNGTAKSLTLRCSLLNKDIAFESMFLSDLTEAAAVAKFKSRPVSKWIDKVQTDGCGDCTDPLSSGVAACLPGEKAFLGATFDDYAKYVTQDARRFICFFRGATVDNSALQEKITTIVELKQHSTRDVNTQGIDISVEGRYRLNGKLRVGYIRCAVTENWARIDSIGIDLADENITLTADAVMLRNVKNADKLDLSGYVNCSAETIGEERQFCHSGDYAFIDIVWENYLVEKWGLEWANVNCTVNGDKDGDGNFDSQYGVIVYRISEPPNSPAAKWAVDEEGRASLVVTHYLDDKGELSTFSARCNIYKDLNGVSEISIFDSNNTNEVYLTYTGASIPGSTDLRIKRNGAFTPSQGGNLGYAQVYWKDINLSSDFPDVTGEYMYLTCRIVHDGGVDERVKAFRVRHGRRSVVS